MTKSDFLWQSLKSKNLKKNNMFMSLIIAREKWHSFVKSISKGDTSSKNVVSNTNGGKNFRFFFYFCCRNCIVLQESA